MDRIAYYLDKLTQMGLSRRTQLAGLWLYALYRGDLTKFSELQMILGTIVVCVLLILLTWKPVTPKHSLAEYEKRNKARQKSLLQN